MGREVRKVPANWQHPYIDNDTTKEYQPMFETYYEDAVNEWIDNHQKWIKGIHPDQLVWSECKNCKYYAEWNGDLPEIKHYNTYYKPEDATWYQLYETTSEGTPVSPPFETKEELAQYLAKNGDYWLQTGKYGVGKKLTLGQGIKLIDGDEKWMIKKK